MSSPSFIFIVALPLGLLGWMAADNGYPEAGFVVVAAVLGLWFQSSLGARVTIAVPSKLTKTERETLKEPQKSLRENSRAVLAR